MPGPLKLDLTVKQQKELQDARDHHATAYVRERASAILKIHEGHSEREVARSGLLKKRRAETLGEWVHRYHSEGLEGLVIRPGRGRKSAFSPSDRGRGA